LLQQVEHALARDALARCVAADEDEQRGGAAGAWIRPFSLLGLTARLSALPSALMRG
jgi:hypothetical protein